MTGLNDYIEYSFMTVGHTKFSCDRCFGCFKKKVRVNPVYTLYDVGKVCEESGDCNISQLVGTHDGTVLVDGYDWQNFLAPFFKKIDKVTEYQHFEFFADGVVKCRVRLEDEPVQCTILKKNAPPLVPNRLPDVISPAGFSVEREAYLYNDIREFCKEGTEGLVAPLPKSKRPRT